MRAARACVPPPPAPPPQHEAALQLYLKLRDEGLFDYIARYALLPTLARHAAGGCASAPNFLHVKQSTFYYSTCHYKLFQYYRPLICPAGGPGLHDGCGPACPPRRGRELGSSQHALPAAHAVPLLCTSMPCWAVLRWPAPAADLTGAGGESIVFFFFCGY